MIENSNNLLKSLLTVIINNSQNISLASLIIIFVFLPDTCEHFRLQKLGSVILIRVLE